MKLLDWQVPLERRLMEMPGKARVVALPTGAGKTYLASEFIRQSGQAALIVCPKTVISAWRGALDYVGVDPHKVLEVINWEQLKTGRYSYWDRDRFAWVLPRNAVIVLDEYHKGASGPGSQITKMVALLKGYPVTTLLLSATPAVSPLQMRATGFLMGEHPFTLKDFYNWCADHGCWFDRFQKRWRFSGGRAGAAHMRAINARIAQNVLYMKQGEIPGFPECMVEARLFDLEAKYRDELSAIYTRMSDEIKTGEAHPDERVKLLRMRQQAELLKVPLLIDLAAEAHAEGTSPVLFVTFRDTIENLCSGLKERGIESVRIHGDQIDRDQQIAAFQANLVHCCVASTQAGGVGISLHDVRKERPRVSFISPSWSASDMKQCLGRIHRTGGTNVVQTFVLVAGTIEEQIHANLQRKITSIEALIDSDFIV